MENTNIETDTLSKRIMKSNLSDDDKIKLIVMVEEKNKFFYPYVPYSHPERMNTEITC